MAYNIRRTNTCILSGNHCSIIRTGHVPVNNSPVELASEWIQFATVFFGNIDVYNLQMNDTRIICIKSCITRT